jgi:glucokinase
MEILLETIPIYAVINEKLGIIGAGEYARQAIEDGRFDLIFN